MEIIRISIAFPGGLTITEGATWDEASGVIHVSARLKRLNREMEIAEASSEVSVTCRGCIVAAYAMPGGDFRIASGSLRQHDEKGLLAGLAELVRYPSKGQRRQFGRWVHTLSAVATIGAVGFCYFTTQWTISDDFSIGTLCVAAVMLFYVGMLSMNGE